MNHLNKVKGARPTRSQAAMLCAAAVSAWFLQPAPAQAEEIDGAIRIPVAGASLADPAARARLLRQIAGAAHTLCPSGGVAAIYREAGRRCRRQAIAEGERQLQMRLATQLAARDGR
jgi:UrcA family protein